jgi:hypothetical protein
MMRSVVAIVLAALGATAASAADYGVVRRTVNVDATPDKVWATIGDFCAITKLLDLPCTYASGTGDVGTIRSLGGGQTLEPMIARTAHSYSYGQILGGMKDYYYHGTIAVEPAGEGKSVLVYTLIYDQEKMTPEVRAAQRTRIEGRFQGAIDKAKALVEAK